METATEKSGRNKAKPPKERQLCPASCIICGAAASGYHYEAPSCTSCKTFFRRTVLQERVFNSCYKGGACSKEGGVTRLCRACRFDRCIAGGMNPLLIISLQDPEANPVVQKYFRKRPNLDGMEPSTSNGIQEIKKEVEEGTTIVPLKRTSPTLIECRMERIIGGLLYLENAHQRLRASPFSPMPIDGYRLDTVLTGHSKLSMLFQESLTPPDPVMKRDSPPPMTNLSGAKKMWPFADLFFACEYLKTFEFFHSLTLTDKRSLARHVTTMCSHLTLAFFSYENGSEITLHPDGTKPHNGLVSKENAHEWQLHHGVIQLLREIDMDRKEYVLLKAIIACNPAIEALSESNKAHLEKERLRYSRSLISYVMCRRGSEGPSTYAAMMSIVDSMTHLMKRHKEFHVLMQAAKFKQGAKVVLSLNNDILEY